MDSMASTAWAKLFDGKLFGLALLVFTGYIITAFAAITLKSDKIPHFHSPTGHTFRLPDLFCKPAMGIDP
jgi:hypothetical protein